ncbi:cytochrome P450 [Novosphingobium malaysiense]|uniref:Cytochrome P450 n=1 Tax=Novosphingobium malaysiense TaxID=1348853 RepID=A0A0B1ZNT9_9SPHN|nr:cytochrome P450 [Novosphingobium malaysiense]KHK90934.1 cytochrome P450 [Novosphingobium malaysiense]
MPQTPTLDDIRVDFDAPDNVPKDRIVDLTFAMGSIPNDLVDPYEPCGWLAGPEIPRLLFNPPSRQGLGAISGGQRGNWVVTHYEDINRVYTDNEHFSNKGTAEFQRLIGETFPSIPLAIDPPEHSKYRLFLTQFLGPATITRVMEPTIRAVLDEMIDEIADKGEVDMAWDFARVFPVRIFMGMMGFPKEMFDDFLEWEWNILHSGNLEKMQWALSSVLKFLRSFIAEKEKNPDEFLTSSIVHGKIQGRRFTEDEKIGMVWFLWLGGLDTVAATISQMFRRMALQPELQRQLREHPALINGAVEEFLRTQPILSSARTATKDFEWHGIQVKKGDSFSCLNPAGNFDPARFENPREFDPTRKGNRHFTLVGGVHSCLGGHLARRELRILLEKWFEKIPGEFRVKPGADTSVYPGLLSIRNLPIVWDVQNR